MSYDIFGKAIDIVREELDAVDDAHLLKNKSTPKLMTQS